MQRYPGQTQIPPGARAPNNPTPTAAWSHYGLHPNPNSNSNPNNNFNPGFEPDQSQYLLNQRELGDYEDEDGSWFVDSEGMRSPTSTKTPRPHSSYSYSASSTSSFPDYYRDYQEHTPGGGTGTNFDGGGGGFRPPPPPPPIHPQSSSNYLRRDINPYGDDYNPEAQEQEIRPWNFPNYMKKWVSDLPKASSYTVYQELGKPFLQKPSLIKPLPRSSE